MSKRTSDVSICFYRSSSKIGRSRSKRRSFVSTNLLQSKLKITINLILGAMNNIFQDMNSSLVNVQSDLLEHFTVEFLLYLAEVFPDDLLTQPFASDQELGHRPWSVVNKPLLYQVFHTFVRLPTNTQRQPCVREKHTCITTGMLDSVGV